MPERPRKARLVRLFQKYAFNPPVRALLSVGLAPGCAVLETTGRKSGQPRRVPVTNGLKSGSFWVVAEHGRSADYVRNIEANPNVRVKIGRRWYRGRAFLLPDDDPEERMRKVMGRPAAAVIRAVGTDLLTIRIDLEPITRSSDTGEQR